MGLENKGGKPYPYNLDYFSKQNLSVQSVSLSRYHCLYVDDKGDIHSVGLGDGGRLGMNNETTLVLPKRVHLSNKRKNEVVTCISAAKNHSVALTSEDRVRRPIFSSKKTWIIDINFLILDFHVWTESVRTTGLAELQR